MPLSPRQEEILHLLYNCPNDDSSQDACPCERCEELIREFVDLIDKKE